MDWGVAAWPRPFQCDLNLVLQGALGEVGSVGHGGLLGLLVGHVLEVRRAYGQEHM